VNRCTVLDADGPGGIVKLETIIIPVFSKRVSLTKVVPSVKCLDAGIAIGVGVEEWANLAPLPADIEKHPPVGIGHRAGTILFDREFVELHPECTYTVFRGGHIIPTHQDALGKEVGVGTGKRKNNAQACRMRRHGWAACFRLIWWWRREINRADDRINRYADAFVVAAAGMVRQFVEMVNDAPLQRGVWGRCNAEVSIFIGRCEPKIVCTRRIDIEDVVAIVDRYDRPGVAG